MKFKKLLIFAIIISFVFFTYTFFKDDKLNYVSLGDSVAAGQNPYGEIGYGYTDYLKDYFDLNEKLNNYSDYAVSGYKTIDIINDINNNKNVVNNNSTTTNIREDLREADVVTISIGANDFMNGMTLSNLDLKNIDNYLKKVDEVIVNVDSCLKLVREYAKNDVIIIGYYNPFPVLFRYNSESVDNLFNYADASYKKIADNYDMKYLSIYSLFKNNSDFLPNPLDIHPSINGYKNIADLIIKTYFS